MAQRLVRALVVEDVPEAVETALLLDSVAAGAWSFFLERLVHPLVAAVLLGFAGLDALGVMPSLIQCTESLKASMPAVAKGGPLSERMRRGSPNSRKARSKCG